MHPCEAKSTPIEKIQRNYFPDKQQWAEQAFGKVSLQYAQLWETVPNEHSFEFEALADGIHQSCHQVTARTGQLMLM